MGVGPSPRLSSQGPNSNFNWAAVSPLSAALLLFGSFTYIADMSVRVRNSHGN